MRHVPEIKLIRTDTTLDLSQKAEKVCFGRGPAGRQKGGLPCHALIGWYIPTIFFFSKIFPSHFFSQLKWPWEAEPLAYRIKNKKREYEKDNARQNTEKRRV